MLQAMNTGHDGSLTTVHANTPRDTLSRIETMVLMAGMDLPVKAIRDQVSKAVDLIVQQERMKDGTRKITHITEVQGMEGDTIILEDIFKFDQVGYEGGKVIGQFRATGARPKSYEKFQQMGVNLPVNVFGKVLLNA
jgi:pilus assembly protein CpaF